ncbi:MAG: hypothetical protein AB8B60_12565, partial [Sulfitobacter sp.]
MKDDLRDILGAVCDGLASGAKPKHILATTNPNGRFRTDYAQARAGVAAALFRGHSGARGQIYQALAALSGGHRLATTPWADLGPVADAAWHDLRAGLGQAQDFYRLTFPTKTLAQRAFRITRLIDLGALDSARELLADFEAPADDVSGADGAFERALLWFRVRDREGDVIAAEAIAAQLHRDHPAAAAASAVPLTYMYRTTGKVAVPRPDRAGLDANIAAQYLAALSSHEDQSEVAPFIRSVTDLIGTTPRLAMAVMPYLEHQNWPDKERDEERGRVMAAARALPLRNRLMIARQMGALDTAWFVALLAEADPGDPVEALPLIEHAISIAPPPPSPDPANDPLPALLRIEYDLLTGRNQMMESTLRTGLRAGSQSPHLERPDDAMVARVRLAAEQDPLSAMRGATVHPGARTFLRDARITGRVTGGGAVLISTHNVMVGAASYISAVTAAEAGFDVISLVAATNRSTLDMHAAWDAETASPHGEVSRGRMTLLNTREEDASVVSARVLAALGAGGMLNVSNDGLRSDARKTIVPWLLRPYYLSPYVVQLALSSGAAVGVQVWWVDEGGLHFDVIDVSPPPARYAPRLRAIWMTQRVARKTRAMFLERQLSFRADVLRLFGGVPVGGVPGGGAPVSRPLETLAEWQRNDAAAASVIGWAVAADPLDPAPALITEGEVV